MTAPQSVPANGAPAPNRLVRAAIWVAIGALVAAAIVCVVWVIIGEQNGIVGRAFLTILLLAAFAGVAILDAKLAEGRRPWFALVSMSAWVLTLIVGAALIWMPEGVYAQSASGVARFFSFLLVILLIQLAVLHIRLYSVYIRSTITFNRIVAYVTIGLVVGLLVLLLLPLTLNEWLSFTDLFWRIVVAVTILAAVGTAIAPLVQLLLAPKKKALPAWPTYADAVTPLPYLPDGSPDWNAYYTGAPSRADSRAWSFGQSQAAPQPAAVAATAPPVAGQAATLPGAPAQAPQQPAPPAPPAP